MYPVQGRRGAVCRFPALALAVLAAVAGLWPAQPARAATVQPAGAATALPVAPAVARQLITVTAASYSSTYATFRAYRRSGHQWVRVLGPWTARVGYHGIAPAGRKREGDGRTPSGTYGFSFFFGVLANPGVTFRWRHAYGYDVWDDDPASPRYNEWVDEQAAGRRAAGIDPEPMHDQPAYDYSAVIAYNAARVPGLGSAIFLHVGTGTATAGCVSLPAGQLLDVLRWLKPASAPQISIRVR